MNNDIQVKILAAVNSIPLSATAIAKKIGEHKASKIMDDLEDLVTRGEIKMDMSGRYPTYTRVAQKKSSKKKATKESKKADTVHSFDSDKTSDTINVINSKGGVKKILEEFQHTLIDGYTVTRNVTNKSGQMGNRVTTPNGKKIFVAEGMTLVIINDAPRYIVDTPVRLVEACHYFARSNNMVAYKISQLGVGSINGDGDVNMDDIVSMTIERIDKGAAE